MTRKTGLCIPGKNLKCCPSQKTQRCAATGSREKPAGWTCRDAMGNPPGHLCPCYGAALRKESVTCCY